MELLRRMHIEDRCAATGAYGEMILWAGRYNWGLVHASGHWPPALVDACMV